MKTTHEPLHLDKRSLVQWKIMYIPTILVLIIIFLDWPFAYSDGGIFRLLRWMQNLHQSMLDHGILYADSSSDARQLLLRPLLRETKNMNMMGCWKLKWTYCLMETTHETLHLDKQIWYNERQWTCLQVLFEYLFSLMDLMNMAMVGFSN
jgi:hypothetical protein